MISGLLLDSEMKRIQSKGIGSKKCQAEPLTVEEELLWKSGQLGHHSPQVLVSIIIFHLWNLFCSTKWARTQNALLPAFSDELIEPGHRAFLRYTEDISKNNPGGLKGTKKKKGNSARE